VKQRNDTLFEVVSTAKEPRGKFNVNVPVVFTGEGALTIVKLFCILKSYYEDAVIDNTTSSGLNTKAVGCA